MSTDNERRFPKSMVLRRLRTSLLLTAVASMAMAAVAARGDGGAPDGWTTAAPRDELRPKFSFNSQGGRDGKGSLRHRGGSSARDSMAGGRRPFR